MKRLIRRLLERFGVPSTQLLEDVRALATDQERLRYQVGALQAAIQLLRKPETPSDAEFQVYSQFGEDGILQFLIHKLAHVPQSFIEFGVENYRESNTRFLLCHDNWRGLVIDGSHKNIDTVRSSQLYWRNDLTAVCAFVDRDNINTLISEHGFAGHLGVLSIDIDGNDYWVWESLRVVDPVIVVAEYNSVFGPQRAVTVPYHPTFVRGNAHHSHLYWGCSLKALCHMATRRGYDFVGSNGAGNNAFFVKSSCNVLPTVQPEAAYVESRFRESRDERGSLTFLSGSSRLREIKHLPLIDVITGQTISAADVLTL